VGYFILSFQATQALKSEYVLNQEFKTAPVHRTPPSIFANCKNTKTE
jgi:hypothetical protein